MVFGGSTHFMSELSGALEVLNVARASQIDHGLLYTNGDIDANTLDFIHFEQCIVQLALEGLMRQNARLYEAQVRTANRSIVLAENLGSRCGWPTYAVFARAVQYGRERLGRAIEFANQMGRETLGMEIARACRPSSSAA